jgi:uncharacterized protein YgbK (DUF1537 family)
LKTISGKRGRLLLAYYGDDFTGSTDVLEALASAGLPAMLFMSPPSRRTLAKFPRLSAFGVAGNSRTMSPGRMKKTLPAIFKALRKSGATLVHYKICSTFDSSPRTGSIGCAIDIAASLFNSRFIPVIAGAPVLGRYVIFGNLFARSGLDSEPSRLDRHPTMARHPVTPMNEADLRLVLGRQTSRPITAMDVLKLESDNAADQFERMIETGAAKIVIFDTLNEAHLRTAGELIWKAVRSRAPLFSASSSGLEYALIAHWRTRRLLKAPPRQVAGPVESTVVMSASCSPVTARQIKCALAAGWSEVPLNPSALLNGDGAMSKAVTACIQQLNRGRNVILHTARGPDDARIARGKNRSATGDALGRALGELLARILTIAKLRRAGVTGGDSSFQIAEALKIEALEYVAPMAPGSPLCRVHAPNSPANGLEFVFKGGQVGRADFFEKLVRGR